MGTLWCCTNVSFVCPIQVGPAWWWYGASCVAPGHMLVQHVYGYVCLCLDIAAGSHYGTHSLRIGGATLAMACPGASEYSVKMLGYWAGDSVRLYTRPTQGAMVELSKHMIVTTKLDIPQFD